MILKKINAAAALLSVLLMLAHIVYSVFSYITFYYNPFLTKILAIPFVILVCIHAVLGMLSVFLLGDGTRMDSYAKLNTGTVLQRVSAALIFPLLILHINTFSLMSSAAENGRTYMIILLVAAELLFFGCIIVHVAVSVTKALITLGILTSPDIQKKLDRIIYIVCAALFVIMVIAVVRGQLIMFLH